MTAPLEVTMHIEAHPETVFHYFTDPQRYVLWMGVEATLEPIAGGVYSVRIREGIEAQGQFLEVDPPRRVVFTWGWVGSSEVPPGSSRVEISLQSESGGTRVVLRHHDLPDEHQSEMHGQGWTSYLTRLRGQLVDGDPGPDPNP